MKDKEHKKENSEEAQEMELEADTEYSEHASKDIVADLRKKLKKSNDEKGEYLLGWQKAKADYINARRQDEESNKAAIKFAEADLISELVPVLDSFELAFADKKAIENLPPEWKKGMEQVRNQFQKILVEHNLEIIDPLGQAFDPRTSEAVGMVNTDKKDEDDKVLSVFQKGYKIHDRVIRPAKVRVGKYSE